MKHLAAFHAGVGGWAESGINPAEYSRTLMRVACAYIEGADTRSVATASMSGSMSSSPCASLSSADNWQIDLSTPTAVVDPRGALDTAHKLTKLPGSATACVVQLDADRKSLIAANLVSPVFVALLLFSSRYDLRMLGSIADVHVAYTSVMGCLVVTATAYATSGCRSHVVPFCSCSIVHVGCKDGSRHNAEITHCAFCHAAAVCVCVCVTHEGRRSPDGRDGQLAFSSSPQHSDFKRLLHVV